VEAASTKAPPTVVIEIGGTLTRMAQVVEGSGLGSVERFSTPNYLTHGAGVPALLQALLGKIRETACEMLGVAAPDVAVIAYPGPVTGSGVALRSPTIFGPDCVSTCDVRAAFTALWPAAQVIVINDVTGAG
jgi:hypothetical protein